LKNGREWPEIKPGDAIEIERVEFVTAKDTYKIRGVVMGKTRRSSDSSLMVINVSRVFPSIIVHKYRLVCL
jgi:ribosomal protein L19